MLPKVRIIAGQWRGRKIEFLNLKSVRPTPDRVRETLFNWLAPSIRNARCLDLFAGSGAIAFEALSRGADYAVLVDNNARVCKKLREQAELIKADNLRVVHQDATQFINHSQDTFDIVFIDPPFNSDLASTLLHVLPNTPILNADAIIYVETPVSKQLDIAQTGWHIVHSQKTSQVRYSLLETAKK
ncbi:MAG: 16S rRNA (guanine(966)-N(2))-methyltransferase RsmD [Gammaproteobacteria bacterium]|nr:16S rRNA (guanine(966)-N(2))-methyltransferase RsmD [Gammaproteobacteria bacterium]